MLLNPSSLIKRNVTIAYLNSFLFKYIGFDTLTGFRCNFHRFFSQKITQVSKNLGYTMYPIKFLINMN